MTELERFRELNKLTDWLTAQAPCYNWRVERTDKVQLPFLGAKEDPLTGDVCNDIGQHIVIVYTQDTNERLFDAICHYGSYGYSDGLLEIMGTIVYQDDGDQVVGYLTADDVIERIINTYG